MKLLLRGIGVATVLMLVALLYMYSMAVGEPVVRRASFYVPDWRSGTPPVTIAFLADIHVAGPDMPPERLVKIVDQVNQLQPDLVLIGGDFVSDKRTATEHYSAHDAIAPLGKLKAPLGAVAVLGNHDHWRNASQIEAALVRAKISVLDNGAVSLGPLRIGGVDDAFTDHADVTRTVQSMRLRSGTRLILSHSPDIAPVIPEDVALLLAGHTHCGQIRLPFVGAVTYMSNYGDRFACGHTRQGSLQVVTSGGLGTSVLPFRLGTTPEIWLVTLKSARR